MVVSDIIEDAAILFNVTPRDLLSGIRTRKMSAVRHALCLALRRRGNELHKVAGWLNVDHTSVIYAERQATKKEQEDPVYALKIKHLVELTHLGNRVPKPTKKNLVKLKPKLKPKLKSNQEPTPDTGEKLDYKALVREVRDIDRIADEIERAGCRVHWTLPSIKSVVFSSTETLARQVGRFPEVAQVTPDAMAELGFA
jgi:hypothetical protein